MMTMLAMAVSDVAHVKAGVINYGHYRIGEALRAVGTTAQRTLFALGDDSVGIFGIIMIPDEANLLDCLGFCLQC